ncbi:hypothetical protein ES703_55405 [subsurface metagenome]
MGFSKVPSESKAKINRAGKILVQDSASPQEKERALDLAERWRASHAYPINTFQATLRKKLKDFSGNPIAAQRLKRMPTIIDKLKRYPAMKLTTMQDIGGVRAILGNVKDVYKLTEDYKNNKRLFHDLVDKKDYIQNPRSEDGYRGVHLIYKYKNKNVADYDGLRLELQIRTKLQHMWATAVESMGTFLGTALKSREGDQEWIDFFAITASAFTHRENRSPVPRFDNLNFEQTCTEVAEYERRLGALDKMRGLSIAASAISTPKRRAWHYHLIVLESQEKRVSVRSYDRESFEEAMNDYGKYEAKAVKGEKIEPVLVSAGPLKQLRQAYPNFFLDIVKFAKVVKDLIRKPNGTPNRN